MSTISKRLIYDNAKKAMVNAGIRPANAVLTQSFLRFEVGLISGQTSYKFDVLTNEQTNFNYNTQQKLNLQDAFICAELGFFLAVPSSNTDTTFRLYTYNNITILTAANAANYMALYHGQMTLTVNQKTVITNWDLSRHYKVPSSQQNVINATYASTVAPAILRGHDELDLAKDGFYPVEPNLVLSGAAKNDFSINLPPGGIPTAVTANSRLVCVMRGILAQNVTSVK